MFKRAVRALARLNPVRALRYAFFRLGNWRRGRFRDLDYVLLTLPAALPALPETRGWLRRRVLGDPPMSLIELERLFEQIGHDPRLRGVVISLRGLQLSLADLQTLRQSIIRLRKLGKRVIFYAQSYDNASYYLASAGDEILLQPGGTLYTLGLVAQPSFFRDALEAIGVQIDAVAISPYKSALDTFTRTEISAEAQAQLDWLLDSRYSIILEGIAEGRRMLVSEVQAMIDSAPHLDEAALAAGYVDGVLNEEGLHQRLNAEHLLPLDQAKNHLLRRWRRASGQYVAVLPLSGTIISGESGSSPVDLPLPLLADDRLGDLTVVRQVRNLMQDKRAAAVVLWIDTPGGSAAASESMAAALDELAKDRPVIAFMNSVAASGGYYIATPARWIIAQPGTITGSIGVFLGKPITNGLYSNLRVNRMEFTRGANANLLSDSTPFNDQQREQMRQGISRSYQQFTGRVAASRRMTPEAVDAVGEGRVWTGKQALQNGLVDELGDLWQAVAKARELAGLPADAPAAIVRGAGQPLGPQLAENPAAALRYAQENLRLIANGRAQWLMPVEWTVW